MAEHNRTSCHECSTGTDPAAGRRVLIANCHVASRSFGSDSKQQVLLRFAHTAFCTVRQGGQHGMCADHLFWAVAALACTASTCSNTNVALFKAYGEACRAFGGPGNSSVAHFQQLPQDHGCQLGLAQHLTTSLSSRMCGLSSVNSIHGAVTRIEQVQWSRGVYRRVAAVLGRH